MVKIKTDFKSPKRATTDLIEKINKQLVEGDKAVAVNRDGVLGFSMDFAFDAALGFVGGAGAYGYEGMGSAGPLFNTDSAVHLECLDSVTVGVYRK